MNQMTLLHRSRDRSMSHFHCDSWATSSTSRALAIKRETVSQLDVVVDFGGRVIASVMRSRSSRRVRWMVSDVRRCRRPCVESCHRRSSWRWSCRRRPPTLNSTTSTISRKSLASKSVLNVTHVLISFSTNTPARNGLSVSTRDPNPDPETNRTP